MRRRAPRRRRHPLLGRPGETAPPSIPRPPTDRFAQHWELPGGAIEIRWPADPRQVYDLEDTRGEPDVFDAISILRPTDGSRAMVEVEHIDPAASATTDTMTIAATSQSATAPAHRGARSSRCATSITTATS